LKDSDEWRWDGPGFSGTDVLVVAEASPFFTVEFTDGITDAEDLVIEEVGYVKVESDRHERGVKFMNEGVGRQKFANKISGGHERVAVGDVKRTCFELNGGSALAVGQGDEEVSRWGDGFGFGGGGLLTGGFILMVLLGVGLAATGRSGFLTMDVFDSYLILGFHFGLGGGELGLGR